VPSRLLLALVAVLATACASGSPAAAPGSGSTTGSATNGGTVSGSPSPSPSVRVEGASYSASTPCGWRTSAKYRHVIWIWMENRTYTSVLGSGSSAPKLASYAGKCGLATNYYAITHPSLPNYLAATSGSTGGIRTDCAPSSCPQKRSSVFGQIQAAGGQWRAYNESMPSNCFQSATSSYAPKHNPAAYFTPVRSRCRSWDIPMGGTSGAFAGALANRTLRAFSFVTPNICHDGHDCSTSTADTWLGGWLGRITSSAAYRAGDTAVFVTWDEGVGTNQHIATVVIAPTVPRALRVSTHLTHYSLLRTTEDLLGLAHLGAAANARGMLTAFHL